MKILVILFLSNLFINLNQDKSAILGKWKIDQDNTLIEITQDGDLFKGTVIKSDKEKALGKEILQDFKLENGIWKGKFYAAKRDRLVDATLSETDDQTLKMEVKAGRNTKTIRLTKAK